MKLSIEQIQMLLSNCEYDHKKQNFYCDCPKCGEHEFGISLYEENHPFQCFRKKNCGWTGNIYSLLKFLNKSDYIPQREVDMFEKVDISLLKKKDVLDLEIKEILPPLGFKRIYSHDYLDERGFNAHDYHKYEIGITEIDRNYIGYVIVLIKQYNKTVGYIGRLPKSKQYIEKFNKKAKQKGVRQILRYRNSTDTDFSKMLLGYDEITENTTEVFLVEGFFDKVTTDKNLKLDTQEKQKCLASFKGSISDEQIELLRKTNIKKIYIMYDGDIVNIVKKSVAHLDSYFDIEVIPVNENDPGDMDINEFNLLFSKRMKAFDFISNKVQILIK